MATKRSRVALTFLLLSAMAGGGVGQERDERAVLTFEAGPGADLPAGWVGGPAETLHLDSLTVHGGRYAGRMEREEDSPGSFSVLSYSMPVEFEGQAVVLRGWMKTEAVVGGYAGLWLRQDGPGGSLGIDNMSDRGLTGSGDWREVSVSITLDPSTRRLVMGGLMAGTGTAWLDDLELLVDGVPVAEAPPLVREPTAVDLDTEFDGGSGIANATPTAVQVENLELLARVWGFLKYHHPAVTAGERHWDYELFRVLPAVLAATDRAGALASIEAWARALGDPPACTTCATLPTDPHLPPPVDWIHDGARLEGLSAFLADVYRNRPTETEQYYVTHHPNVGNPQFANEADYAALDAPDAGYRLLGLFRFWNIIEYWFPYRDVLDADWGSVLREYVPRMLTAESADAYALAMMEVIARVDDTHANLWSSLAVRPPVGDGQLPVLVRFVEGRPVVTGFAHEALGPASGLRRGDVIERLDGAPVDSLVDAWEPYYATSNEPTRLRDVTRSLTRGPVGPVRVTGRRASGPFEVESRRVPTDSLDRSVGRWHDRPGDTFQRLDDDVAYLKLSSVKQSDVGEYIRGAEGARVLVIDIRNYPSAFMPFALGQHLVAEPTPFARFTRADAANPGAFRWTEPVVIQPAEPRFTGRVVILLDEVSQSQSEYTAMAFRQAPGALVVGSTTAGADGNVSGIPLPGGLDGMISGIGVFYPDRTPTQRIGIVPDLVVTPTLDGVREGRDEVLEAAVSHALGRAWSAPPPAGDGGDPGKP